MGWAGDRTRRTRLLALGVGLWSLATIGTGLSRNYTELRLARSLLGLGEATYGVLAPTLLMDLYPRERRSRILSYFYLAMPFGYALGVILGGRIAEATGNWRMAFFVVGAPGLPRRWRRCGCPSRSAGPARGRPRAAPGARAGRRQPDDYLELMVNSSYTYTVFGLAAYTFAFGGWPTGSPRTWSASRGCPRVRPSTSWGSPACSRRSSA
jgi:MFS family permease